MTHINKILFLILIFLTISCKYKTSDNGFRQEIDRIKNEELPKQKYSMTSFEIDSLNGTKFFCEIKRSSDKGSKSISVITKYSKNDSLIGIVESGPFENTNLLKRKILKDKDGIENLYYLLEDSNGKYIYVIKYKGNTFKNSRIDSTQFNWNDLIFQLKD